MRERVSLLSVLFQFCFVSVLSDRKISENDIKQYRQRVVNMFHHAYDGYIKHAYPYDELRPLTCDGQDTWGSFSLTLIDALDTLAIMGNNTEFRRVAELVIEKMNFDIDINASVFETNIRILGGLLSAHLFTKRAEMDLEPGWPCSGPLLRLAEDVARRLLPAFDTPTGMPYGTVNLRHGVPKGETPVTCTAGVGTFIIEFGTLSRLTGDPVFEKAAMRAMRALWNSKSELNLVGNHIDVVTNKWTALDAGIGGGIDSYFEYLVKGAIMFDIPELLEHFRVYEKAIEKHVKRDDWYMWAHMSKGGITLPMFTSLDAYWPGIQSLLGNIDKAMKTIHNFHQVWRQFGFTPEYYNIPKNEAHAGREGYPLRPELIESAMYLYRATKDPFLLEIGVDMLESIEHSTKTDCGYATVKNVNTHQLDNRMESFFLAETTKYLYLLFDPDNFIHNNGSHGTVIQTPNGECVIDAGGYFFTSEAHPIDAASVYCCSSQKKEEDAILQDMHDNLDLLSLFNIHDDNHKIQGTKLKMFTKDLHKERFGEVGQIFPSQRKDKDILSQNHEIVLDILKDYVKNPDEKVAIDKILTLSSVIGGQNEMKNTGKIDRESENKKLGPEESSFMSEKHESHDLRPEKSGSENKDKIDRDEKAERNVVEREPVDFSTDQLAMLTPDKSDFSTKKNEKLNDEKIPKDSQPKMPEANSRNTQEKQNDGKTDNEYEDLSKNSQNTKIKGPGEGVGNVNVKDKKSNSGVNRSATELSSNEKLHEKVVLKVKTDTTGTAEGKIKSYYIKERQPNQVNNIKMLDKNVQNSLTKIEKLYDLLFGTPKQEVVTARPNAQHLYQTLQHYSLDYHSRPEIMVCRSQPFYMRMSVNGEMFTSDDIK